MTPPLWESPDRTAAIAAYGLTTRFDPPPGPLPDDSWNAVLSETRSGRLYGFLVSAVEDGWFPTTEAQREQLRVAHGSQVAHELQLERELVKIASFLDSSRIPYRLMKGAAVSHAAYPDPGWRCFGDLDLLIHRNSFGRACHTMEELGYRQEWPELRPGFDARFGKGGKWVARSGHEADLHASFVLGALGILLDPDDLFATETRIDVGGRTVATLGPEELFLQSCYAAVLADRPPSIRYARDVAEMALRCDLDADRVVQLARAWSARPVVATALVHSWSWLRLATGGELIDWARDLRASLGERVLTAVHYRYGHTAAELAGLAVVRGLRPRISYATALAFPDPGYRAAMGRTPLGHLREAGRRLATQSIRRQRRTR